MSEPFGPEDRRPQNDDGDERATLTSYLNWQRDTLRWKAGGLTPDQLAGRPVASSTMSLLGLVRHVAEVERGWRDRTEGVTRDQFYTSDEQPDATFTEVVAEQPAVDRAYADWASAQTELDATIAARDLGATFDHHGQPVSIRSLLAHMIEEYARHNGHADLLREAIDGSTGE